jgi:hypothetical protein
MVNQIYIYLSLKFGLDVQIPRYFRMEVSMEPIKDREKTSARHEACREHLYITG